MDDLYKQRVKAPYPYASQLEANWARFFKKSTTYRTQYVGHVFKTHDFVLWWGEAECNWINVEIKPDDFKRWPKNPFVQQAAVRLFNNYLATGARDAIIIAGAPFHCNWLYFRCGWPNKYKLMNFDYILDFLPRIEEARKLEFDELETMKGFYTGPVITAAPSF